MYEIDMASPGLDPADDGSGGLGGGLDMTGLDPTPEELAILMDAIGDASEEEWAAAAAPDPAGYDDPDDWDADLAGWAAALSGDELAALEALAAADVHAGAAELDGAGVAGGFDMAGEVARIDYLLAGQAEREAVRQREDAASGGRVSTEVRLASALERVARGTYIYGQLPADLAGDPGADDLPGTPAASQLQVMQELQYQLRGGTPPALQYRQPMPQVGGLAAAIGLR